ncbi:MAG: Ribosomal protein L11 methyltransferase [Alphaproteobacteria bacterium ADurb.Bin438]|nr:MAG: Ribosomal protein L11 methyltransferase [Alphaproteobacteria bacterium ADurb.Bin438]
MAVDIDKEATRVTSESAKTNEVSEYITTCTGNGYKDDMVKDGALYDLILANILARPLISMASDARRNLRPDGILVLSGLLQSQEDWVSSAYRVEGFTLIKKYHIGEWSALIFHG